MNAKERFSIREQQTHDYLYARVARRLRELIGDGTFPAGARIPSLDDLAKLHGVNRLTVRKALSELRKDGLIYAVPAQGTYVSAVPQGGAVEAGSRSNTSRTAVFGLLSHVLNPASYGPYHQSILAGIHEELGSGEANLLVIAAGTVPQDEFPGLMRRSHADAMIYLGPFDGPVLAHMVRQGPPAVVVDFHLRGLACDSIRVDNAGGAADAIRHLASQGWGGRLAVIAGLAGDAATIERTEGMRTALLELGIPAAKVPVVAGDYLRTGGEAAMKALLRRRSPPRAVFCMNDEMAVGALDALHAAGLACPDDVALVGFDDILWAVTTRPQLTTMRVDSRQMGRMAVRLLRARIDNPAGAPSVTVISPELVRRGST